MPEGRDFSFTDTYLEGEDRIAKVFDLVAFCADEALGDICQVLDLVEQAEARLKTSRSQTQYTAQIAELLKDTRRIYNVHRGSTG